MLCFTFQNKPTPNSQFLLHGTNYFTNVIRRCSLRKSTISNLFSPGLVVIFKNLFKNYKTVSKPFKNLKKSWLYFLILYASICGQHWLKTFSYLYIALFTVFFFKFIVNFILHLCFFLHRKNVKFKFWNLSFKYIRVFIVALLMSAFQHLGHCSVKCFWNASAYT